MRKSVVFLLIGLVLASALVSAVAASGRGTGPRWAYLIYLDADNSLDVSAGAHHVPVVEDDFAELMSVGSTADVVAYVLVDRVAAAAVVDAFDATVIALQATQTVDHQVYGLGLEFPNHSWETPGYLWGYAFMEDGFEAFLEAYWSAAGSA